MSQNDNPEGLVPFSAKMQVRSARVVRRGLDALALLELSEEDRDLESFALSAFSEQERALDYPALPSFSEAGVDRLVIGFWEYGKLARKEHPGHIDSVEWREACDLGIVDEETWNYFFILSKATYAGYLELVGNGFENGFQEFKRWQRGVLYCLTLEECKVVKTHLGSIYRLLRWLGEEDSFLSFRPLLQ